jgi:propanol-preferring alcohol dehydrogenase
MGNAMREGPSRLMRAVRVKEEGGLVLAEVPVPDPGPGQVLVEVAGAGLCHSDCLLRNAPEVNGGGPFTLGHEVAGWVEAVGPGVSGVREGDAVLVHCLWGCGQCPACRRGTERFCPNTSNRVGPGLGHDGGYADYVLVPNARHVLPLGDLDPVDAGPLADAALTPYHPMRTRRDSLGPGSVAVVIGVGGLGHMAVQLLRALTPATVVAVELDQDRRAFALELGADLALDPADEATARIKELGWAGATFTLDLVASDATLAMAAAASAPGGEIVVVGAALGSLPVSLLTTPFECRVSTTLAGEANETEELIALAQAGRIRVHTEHISLDEVPDHLNRLDSGHGPRGRYVATRQSTSTRKGTS